MKFASSVGTIFKKPLIHLLVALALLSSNFSHATSFTFLTHAIREYSENPNSETRATLVAAQRKAEFIEISAWAVPASLIAGFIIIRLLIRRKVHTRQDAAAKP